jgi:hypothetical protein
MIRTVVGCLLLSLSTFASAAEFKDVPKDHWAAEAVQKVADAGIMQGYPDKTFKGDKPVTRFELAVALERFVEFIQQSRKPLEKPSESPSKRAESGEQRAESPAKKAVSALKSGGFLPADSKLLKDGNKSVTANDLAEALASVAQRLIEVQDTKHTPQSAAPAKDSPQTPAASEAGSKNPRP